MAKISKSLLHTLSMFIALLASIPLFATAKSFPFPQNCYALIGKERHVQTPKEALFILIDESVGFDATMADRVMNLVLNALDEGKFIEVIRFSSTGKERYTEVVIRGLVDPEPTDDFLDNIRRSERLKFEQCHKNQLLMAKIQVKKAINAVFAESNTAIGHSDILANLQTIADHIRNSPAQSKKVLLVSDMLENSSITSFYNAGHVKKINPKAELAAIEKKGYLADFGGAKISIFGMGYLARSNAKGKEAYLGPDYLFPIKTFWESYIKEANAQVGEIGTPMLLGTF